MIKNIYLAQRNPNTSFEEFMKNWADHAALSGSFPDVVRSFDGVVQVKRVIGLEHPSLSDDYDGSNILTLTGLQDAVDIHDREGIPTLREDEMRVFADYVRDTTVTAHCDIIKDVPIGEAVLLEFARARDGQDKEEFVKAWGRFTRGLQSHEAFSTVGYYSHNHTIMPPPPGYEYDAISETWFDSVDDAVAFVDATQKLYDEAEVDVALRTVFDRNHVWFRRR